ncbi:LOW QUALITY PROTEIN: trafficking protein particle complex subunit 9-like [Uloborus diversus]|uniref:LOW QUALITY PROTEIN: trafficking protein particle complex subunit 9-like n=1 Tax=Uloborus diversus TaxID=327109 RepID=UPI00240A5C36|nr:LOW QUALITY PROTEIN: trafficking protein particle complex subunit 9-like [Uloborus diversus]
MSVPDYTVCADDHRTILVLVKKIGDKISQKSFNNIYEKISRINHLKLKEGSGSENTAVRSIFLRYKSSYPPENNEWGDLQTYRKVLGLISVGKYELESNVQELCKEHNALQEKYCNSVFDSRCLAFGSDSNSPSEAIDPSKFPFEDQTSFVDSIQSPVLENSQNEVFKNTVEPVPKSHISNENENSLSENSSSPDNNTPDIDSCKDFTSELSYNEDFFSLPNVNISENCKTDFSCNNNLAEHNFNYVCSNSSSSLNSAAEGNSPSNSKKIIIPSTVNSRRIQCIIYPSADNYEQIEHDIKEFASSLFWVLESKRLDRSFEKQDKISLLTAPFEKKSFVGIDTDTRVYKRRCIGRMKKYIGDLALQAGLTLEALSFYTTSVELLKACQDWLWLGAAFEGQCAASTVLMCPEHNAPLQRNSSVPLGIHAGKVKNVLAISSGSSKSLPIGVDAYEYKQLGKHILSLDEIEEKYMEAVIHYQKYQGAIVLEMECSIKAAKVLATQEKYLQASECLKNVIFTSLSQTDYEKMRRFDALAKIYTDIGFHRKAAFFKRIAAMRCVAGSNDNQNWLQCYHLLLQSLEGYNLPLDAQEFPKGITYGWPSIQVQALHDLAGVAEQMNNQAIAVRHLTFLLHTLLHHLTSADQQKLCEQLAALTAKCEGAPVPLTLDNGLIIPPVNLINLPSVKSFKLQNLAPHLRPVKIATQLETDQDSIFIFSAIPREKDNSMKNGSQMAFKWVEGDVCEVSLQVFNPLYFELKVTHMGLQADNIPFESFPACLSLPAQSGPYPVNLLGMPLSSGELQILGYTTHVLGIKSNCRLREIPAIKKQYFSIDVIPRLPQIQVTTSLPKASMFSSLGDTSYVVASASTTMYAGECQECTITITNRGKELVEMLDISLHSKLKKDKEYSFFTWSKENLQTQLPVAVGHAASFTLYINAMGEFVNPSKLKSEDSRINQSCSKSSRSSSTSSYGGTPNKRKPLALSSPEPFPPKTIEAVLQIQYSGGPGMKAGYCRRCAVALTIEVLPSVVITKWDVLPSEMPSHCYLVLDVLNSTTHEMELQYASNKRILIEAHDICRIPVSVERCPLSAAINQDMTLNISGNKKVTLLTTCRDHLVNLVDLQWVLSALEISGKASISEITWTDEMLGVILMSPVQWEIFLNERLFKSEYEFSYNVGELITLGIKLQNVSDIILNSLQLCVKGYQDHQNGHKSYHLETKRAVVGSDRLIIKEIHPHEEYTHNCGFVFFHPGVYKLDILFCHKDIGIWPQSASDSVFNSIDKNSTSFFAIVEYRFWGPISKMCPSY